MRSKATAVIKNQGSKGGNPSADMLTGNYTVQICTADAIPVDLGL